MADHDLMRKIASELYLLMTQRPGNHIPVHDITTGLPYSSDNIFDVIKDLITAKFIEQRGLAIGPGVNFPEWREFMTPKPVPSQQFNIGSINGPAHVGGHGDINITMTQNEAEVLVELIRELSKPQPKEGLLKNVQAALTSGKTALEIVKLLIAGV